MRLVVYHKHLNFANLLQLREVATATVAKIRVLECPDIRQHIHNFAQISVNFVLPLYISLYLECT